MAKRLSFLRELLGRSQRIVRRVMSIVPTSPTRDVGVPDYAFWDRAYFGKARGLEFSGAFIKPLVNKVAENVLGNAPRVKFPTNEVASQQVTEWLALHHRLLLDAYIESLRLGDAFLVLNGDMSVSILQPDVAYPLVDANDFGKIVGWEFRQVFPHPEKSGGRMTVIDRYTATERIRLVTTNLEDATVGTQTRWRNPLGILPVIHLRGPNSVNEMFGRPLPEPILPVLYGYNDALAFSLDGIRKQGRPTPVIEGVMDEREIELIWSKYAKSERVTLDDGTEEEVKYLHFDSDQVVTLAGNAEFNWKSPQPFMGDAEKMLGLLFYLIVQHSEQPEYIFGNAISSSKASTETQDDPFQSYIDLMRGRASEWLLELVRLVAAAYGAFNVRAKTQDQPIIVWSEQNKRAAEITLKALDMAKREGVIDELTYLMLLPLSIENPVEVLEKAKQEAEAARDAFDRDVDDALTDEPSDEPDEEEDEEAAA